MLREGQAHAFHLGPDDACGDGLGRRRRHAVGLVKEFVRGRTVRLTLALLTIAGSAWVIEAGQRWK
jgi:hypothetical protein